VVDTLEYLVRGGRAGRAAGLLAAALDIKPILNIEEDGVIAPAKKCRGRKKAYQKMANIVTEKTADVSDLHYFMLYTNDEEDAEQLHGDLQATGFTVNATYEGMQQVGIIVGIYAGPGTSALVYWQDLDPKTFRTE
jgi:DegV family protein with EDD domain